MIYNIAYNENFVEVLSEIASDSLLILPGKYLTTVFKNCGFHAISYDDLWFNILPSRASHITESIIVDRVIKGNYSIKSQLRKAINEFFYYGLNIKNLICSNSQHDLLQKTVVELYKILDENNISLRASALQDILNSQLNLNFNKPVYAVLPVIFSPLLFKILQLFREKFSFNLVMHGYDEAIDYDILSDHPQYFMREFLKVIQPKSIVNLTSYKYDSTDQDSQYNLTNHEISSKEFNSLTTDTDNHSLGLHKAYNQSGKHTTQKQNSFRLQKNTLSGRKAHPNEINAALSQLMYPAKILYRLHNEELYNFNHIERFSTKSVAEEFKIILSIVENTKVNNISIVSKNSEKLKILYSYLKGKLKISRRSYRIKTSTPTYCYDYLELRLFFKVLDVIGTGKASLSDIFELLKQSQYNQEMIYLAEKTLLEIEELSDEDIKYAEKILVKNEMFEVLDILKKVSSYSSISNIKGDIQLPIELSDSNFDKFLKAHIVAYTTIIGCAIDKRLLQLLTEIRNCINTWDISLKEYKATMLELSMRAVISSEESFTTSDGDNHVSLELLTSIERRFLSYDLTIICDLKEGIWPPEVEDHFFISEQTRRLSGYTKPSHYEIGYSAHDFVSIIASSNKVIISELHVTGILSKDVLKRSPLDSRFLSILYGYRDISGHQIKTYHTNELKNDMLKLHSEAIMDIPIESRPVSISATSLEKLMKNPYIYSLEYNLHLKYLRKFFNDKAKLPSNRDFGIIIHNILNQVSKEITYKESYDNFRAIFQSVTQSLVVERYGNRIDYIMTCWQGKFNNIMNFIYNYNRELYDKHNYELHTETEKSIAVNIKIADKNVKLHAFADRLDHTPKLLYISDYKTGQLPSKQDIVTGKKPQLNLEALIITLLENNFDLMNDDLDNLKERDIILRYIRLTGIELTNEIKDVDFDLKTTLKGISDIIRKLYLEGIPYNATEQYDNYLQRHIMRTSVNIEHKF